MSIGAMSNRGGCVTELDRLYAAARTAIAEGRVGRPVFLRCFVQVPPGEGGLQEALQDALGVASGLLDGAIARVFALGGLKTGQVSVSLEFSEGQRALIAACAAGAAPGRLEWLLLGNKGSLCFEDELPQGRLAAAGADLQAVWEAVVRSLEDCRTSDVAEEDLSP